MNKYVIVMCALLMGLHACKKKEPEEEKIEIPKAIAVSPFDILYDKDSRQMYFFEREGKISLYSVQDNQMLLVIDAAATIGYCDFGVYNGVKELYVPRNDGWVFVYNAKTLQKIDQINVGSASTCVAYNNKILYVSTELGMKVFNRVSKNQVGNQLGDRSATRFKLVPNTLTDLLEITINISPDDQYYWQFNAVGNYVQRNTDLYHGDHPLDAGIIEIFPTGNKYITSSYGAIYTKDMVYEASLPRGNLYFRTFAFDAGAHQIYAGTRTKSIEVYSESDYSKVRSIPTQSNPIKLFKDQLGFICVTADTIETDFFNPFYGAPKNIRLEIIQ